MSSAPSVRTRRHRTYHSTRMTARLKIYVASLNSHAFEHSTGRSAHFGAPSPAGTPHAAFGADGLQLLGLLTTGATIAKKGLHYRCWSKLHPPHARSTPDRPSMSPEQHAVIPRDAHYRGAPCGRRGHGACRVSGAVLLMAIKSMPGGSTVRLGPAEDACSECSLARECACHYSKGGNPVY